MNRLITFMSVHQAIKAELLFEKLGYAVRFRPTPRALSVSCGQSMLFEDASEPLIIAQLRDDNIVWNNLFEIHDAKGSVSYARIGGYEDYQLE